MAPYHATNLQGGESGETVTPDFSSASSLRNTLCTPYVHRDFPTPALVLARGSLAGLELLKVPAADLHVAALVVHALRELLGRALAVVAPAVVVLALLLVLRLDRALLRLGRRR